MGRRAQGLSDDLRSCTDARVVLLTSLFLAFTACCPASVASSSDSHNPSLAVSDRSSRGRPIAGAILSITGIPVTLTTGMDGSVRLSLVPAGRLDITVTWKSIYNPEPVTIARSSITVDRNIDTTISATVYDAELQLISPSGKPIANAEVSLAGVALGVTGADGRVLAIQVPSWHTPGHQPYPVIATWFGEDVSPGEVVITSTKTYRLTARNVATLTVQVVGAQGQGLDAAQVEVKTSAGQTVFSGISNEQGVVSVEVPYGTYDITVNYKGFENAALATVDTPQGTIEVVSTNVFIEVLGIAMTFATFVLWLIVIAVVVLVLVVVAHEYHIWRRKRLPELFAIPKVRAA